MTRALVLLRVNQHTKFEVPSFTNSKDMIGAKSKKRSHECGHAYYGVVGHRSQALDIYSTCIQNVATVASAILGMIAGIESEKWVK